MAAQQQQQQGDNSLAPLWITVLFLLTVLFIWYYAHEYIVTFVFTVKIWQAELVSLFTNALQQDITIMKNVAPASVSFNQMAAMSTEVGNYIRYPVMVIMTILAVVLYFRNATLKYRKTYTMEKLAKMEYPNWPQITPVIKLDLLNQDLREGPWAMAMNPKEFAKDNKVLKLERVPAGEDVLQSHAQPRASIHKGESKRLFSMQLGEYWQSPEALPIHTRALFAAFAARMNRDRDGSANLLHQISASAEDGQLDFSGADKLLVKHFNTDAVQRVVQRHAYVQTVMASMLQRAREDGVLPSADFLWLKPMDRTLWFNLNCVGRQTSFSEVAGIFSHWLVEKALGRKVMVPMVDCAVSALEDAIKDIKFSMEELDEVKE